MVGVTQSGWRLAVLGGAAGVTTPIATRMASVSAGACGRRRGPGPSPPSTIGMIQAEHARRRASVAEMRPPESRVQTPAASRSASSCSRVMVTTTVAQQPPVIGNAGRIGLDQLGEARPSRTGAGRSGSTRTRASGSAGEEIASIILRATARAGSGYGTGHGWCLRRPPTSSTGSVERLSLFGLQRPAFERLGQLGGDHLEDAPAQQPRALASWWSASSTRWASAWRAARG